MQNLLDTLRKFDALRDQQGQEKSDIVKTECTDSIAPEFADNEVFNRLSPKLVDCVKRIGVDKLYQHQEEAILAALQGQDVVLESPTASGKTLSFCLPMLKTIVKDKSSHALMLYPMKALANDQRRQLQDMQIKETLGIESWLYDGDTDEEYKKPLRKSPSHILITNPDYLHRSFLGRLKSWNKKFFDNLKYIVIDEIHEYRGYFGTNFAFLMRRFLCMLKQRGVEPQLFLSTATCANPKEHAEKLTGRKDITLVSSAKKIAPKRNFIFVDPNIPDYKYYNIFSLRIVNAGLACLSEGYSTLVFCASRKLAEDCYKTACRKSKEYGLKEDEIAPYRSGYKSEERRDIENGLRNGEYKLIFSTNALELGIDIGRLDIVILAGFPDNVLSAWQRIGRAGRSWKQEAYVIFYALNNAFDKFYAENIKAFIEKPLDEITVSTDNKEIMENHLPFLLWESKKKITENDRAILGDSFYELALSKIKNTQVNLQPSYLNLNIRGGSSSVYKMMHGKEEVGSMSDVQVFKEAYIGAIYNHFSNTYKVSGHGDNNKILLEKSQPYLVSEPVFFTQIYIEQAYSGSRPSEKISVFYGESNY